MPTDEEKQEIVAKVLLALTEDDLVFQFAMDGVHWYVYHFGPSEHRGTIVFTMPEDGNPHVGLFVRMGTLTVEEVRTFFETHRRNIGPRTKH